MNHVKYFLMIPFFLNCLSSFSQDKQAKNFSIKKVEKALNQIEKLMVIQLSTEWCVYCKMQDRQLKKDKEIIKLLQEKTFYLKLDAESKDTIRFNETVFSPSPYKNGLHDFALAVIAEHQQPSFPLWVIFNKDHEIVYRQSGLVKAKELVHVLKTLLSVE